MQMANRYSNLEEKITQLSKFKLDFQELIEDEEAIESVQKKVQPPKLGTNRNPRFTEKHYLNQSKNIQSVIEDIKNQKNLTSIKIELE
jgi:hypothetical protein